MDESANTPEPDRPLGIPERRDPSTPGPLGHGRDRDGALGREIEDDGPEPDMDPHLEGRVRDLLAEAPDPGPMPDEVAQRISRALVDAARLRVEPGPLAVGGQDNGAHPGGGTVLVMPSRAGRPKPIYLAAAVAAAAAVVAVGASALHVTKGPNGAAAIGDSYSSAATAAPSSSPTSPPVTTTGLHIQLGTTAYSAGNLAAEARRLLDHPGQPIRDLVAESPGIGPIATPVGLESCLEAIRALDAAAPAPEAVSADISTFDGRPAVVVVVTRAGASTAWAVGRSCRTGAPGVLKDATPVP